MAIDPVSAVQAGIGVIQTVGGIIGQGKSNRQIAELLSKRKAFKTSDEVYQILEATQSNAGNGLGGDVLAYLTGNNDRALSSGISASTLLGGDANDLAGLLDRYNNTSMGIGAQDQAAKMANFSQYLGALSTLAQNKDAEWQSEDNLLKDRIQAAAAKGANSTLSLQSGLNSILGAASSNQMMELYGQKNPKDITSSFTGEGRTYGNLPLLSTNTQINSPTLRTR